jgi:hypothetical protein
LFEGNKLVQKDLQFFFAQQGGADRFLHFDRHVTDAIEMHLLFKQNTYACSLVPDQTGGIIFKEEYCLDNKMSCLGDIKKQALASTGDKETALPDNASTIASHLSDWQVYHFHDTSDTAKVKQSGTIHDNERLRPQAENLAAFLFSILRRIPENCANHSASCPFFSGFYFKTGKNRSQSYPTPLETSWH